MEEEYLQDPTIEINTRIRDMEEKQRLLKERLLLVGKSLVEEKSKTFNEIQQLKNITEKLKEDNERLKSLVQQITENLNKTARKEELLMLQRQFNLFRGEK